ncbi:efflux RND transporter periplasmic adaptor subunit [Rhodocytophaga aerolata]|uniref:Efflux RND transporter periplasmic adaptor subunit n=1 Tax=Rhodocytophaga aerolata TaxID=455078 RepID=A0ABT8RH23_9BACT|nr:efflux RND transporter periplasmic adaptor subunit [Rhodocytophaga aerolata]MDO1450654.1 efflux RND transporter periplasmic adaptor subunit [Rhodocytophaga aerolata]
MQKLLYIPIFSIALLVSSCSANRKVDDAKTTDHLIPVTSLITKDTLLYKEYVTDIHAVRNVEIRARVEGFLEKRYVDEGQQVKKGQRLFRINDEEYKAALAKAKANLKSAIAGAKAAQLEVDRVRMLVEKKVISTTELGVAEAKLSAAKAKIDEAHSAQDNASIRLSYTYIRAPFDGIIDRIPLKVGSLIDEGTLLTTLSDNREVYAYFNVSENEYLTYIKAAQKKLDTNHDVVELTLADGTRFSHQGKIETMEGEFESGTGSIAFRARFANPEKILKHGSTGRIRLTSDITGALMVPQKAVFEIQDKNYVFVVDRNNKVKMKSFTPRNRISYFYISGSGLEVGERIVYEGVQNLREGMQIQPQYISMDSLIARAP